MHRGNLEVYLGMYLSEAFTLKIRNYHCSLVETFRTNISGLVETS